MRNVGRFPVPVGIYEPIYYYGKLLSEGVVNYMPHSKIQTLLSRVSMHIKQIIESLQCFVTSLTSPVE